MLEVAAGTGTRRLTLGCGDIGTPDLMAGTPRQARPEEINPDGVETHELRKVN